MKTIKSIIFILISLFIFNTFNFEVYASNSFSELETKVNFESNESKIKKVQLTLDAFWLYKWKIDWNYVSVKDSLIKYQKNKWITKNLWYFWIKTLTALKEDYPSNFEKVTQKYLKMDKPATNIRKFIVSAYYSVVPWQERYSYSSALWRYRTYTEAIRMQWKWTHWASWKWVHVWMLAAPKNYKFWTKIEFKWLWIWVVEDRWNAIVNAWTLLNSWKKRFKYDRIDIWMWYGDEWRIRAEQWGTRTIEWKVVPDSRFVTIEFDKSVVAKYKNLKVNAENPKKENVEKLQKLLKDVNLFSWKIDWKFNSVKNILVNYQIENSIIKSYKSDEAWYFWKLTYVSLRRKFWWDIFKEKSNKLDEDIILAKDVKDKLDKIHIRISNIINNKYWKNTLGAKLYKAKLRLALDYHTQKINNKFKKKQLQYLKSLI